MRNKSYIIKIAIFLFVLILPITFSCSDKKVPTQKLSENVRDLDQIRMDGKITVVTDFNSVNYFIYKGKPMGFQYELLQELSDYLGLKIDVKVNNDLKKNFDDLVNGNVDLIASNLSVTKERKKIINFTAPHSQSRQVLVQRKDRKKGAFRNQDEVIRNPIELAGKTIYVQKNSSHATRLSNLSDEIGEKINMVEVPIETEQLIRMVAREEIEYTVADENIANVNSSFFPLLDVETVISFPQNQAWAVRKESVELKNEIDKWLEGFRETRRFAVLQHKYFRNGRQAEAVKSEFYYAETGRISNYDNIIKEESLKVGWDWRLLASLIYQESRFNPDAVSWAGAFGIMQMMPFTAAKFGIDGASSPAAQIRAGVRFIHWLDLQLESYVPDKQERIKFILASYNIGMGHVLDAIKLADKYGKNPQIWEDNVEYYLLKKSESQYFSDPVVRHGYARGTETYRYVRDIMYRYNHYLNVDQNLDVAQILE